MDKARSLALNIVMTEVWTNHPSTAATLSLSLLEYVGRTSFRLRRGSVAGTGQVRRWKLKLKCQWARRLSVVCQWAVSDQSPQKSRVDTQQCFTNS